MKYIFALVVALCAVSCILADCGCTSCSRGNLQFVPSRSNVEVIYKGQACPCQRALPYQVEIPVEPIPENRQQYEYQVVAPPRPSPPAQRYIYNYQLQVPVEQPPAQRLNGLLARLDRVVLPAPDCRSVQPAYSTDSNAELYSDGNELTPIAGGYQSQTVYNNGAYNPSYVSGSNYDNYNTLSNSYDSVNQLGVASNSYSGINVYNAQNLDQDRSSYTLSPCNTVRGPFLEKLGYNRFDEPNDYYRYERSSDYSDDIASGEFIEAHGPYIPDSDGLDNLSIKNSEYGILREVPKKSHRDRDDYSDESVGYGEENISKTEESDYSDESDYSGQGYLHYGNQQRSNIGEQGYNSEIMRQLYLQYAGQQNSPSVMSRRRRDLNQNVATTTENTLQSLFDSYKQDCSVPSVNKSDVEEKRDSSTGSKDEGQVIKASVDLKNKDLAELFHAFQKYDQLKQTQQKPVPMDKFLMNYPNAAKIASNIAQQKTMQGYSQYADKRQHIAPNMVRFNPSMVKTSKYFKPPVNQMRFPKPQVVQQDQGSEEDEEIAYKEHTYNVNGIDIGATRKPRSSQPKAPTMAHENHIQVLTYPISTTNPKNIFSNIEDTENVNDFQNAAARMRKTNVYKNTANVPAFFNNYETSSTAFNIQNSNRQTGQTHMLQSQTSQQMSQGSEDATLLYQAIDMKQKLRDHQKQTLSEDSQLYQKYLQVPATQNSENKYSQYFKVPQFERLNINGEQPEIFVPRAAPKDLDAEFSELEQTHQTPMYVEGKICKRHGTFPCRCHLKNYSPNVKFYNPRTKSVCAQPKYLADSGFGQHFFQTTPKFKRDNEVSGESILNNQPLVNLVETQEINFQGDELAETSENCERFERTLGYIIRKLQNKRLLNYIKRKYNERLAHKLDSVVRNFETLGALNSGSQFGYNSYGSQFASERHLTNNFVKNNVQSNYKVVYDSLGHKYVERDGFRRLIKPNLVQTNIVDRPCTNSLGFQSSQVLENDCSNSKVFLETETFQRQQPRVFKTDTIEIIKPEQHFYYPEQKFVIQKQFEVEQPIVEEIQITEEIEPCGESKEIIKEEIITNNEIIEREEVIDKSADYERRTDDINIIINVPQHNNLERVIEKEVIHSYQQPEVQTIVEETIVEEPCGEVVEEIIEKEIEIPSREVVVKEVIDVEVPQYDSANVEIKETIKKYQIPVQVPYSTCNHHTTCNHHHHHPGQTIQHIEKEIDIIDNNRVNNQNNILIEQNQHLGHNHLVDSEKLTQLQQYVNLLQLLQSQKSHDQQAVLNNLYTSQNSHIQNPLILNNLLNHHQHVDTNVHHNLAQNYENTIRNKIETHQLNNHIHNSNIHNAHSNSLEGIALNNLHNHQNTHLYGAQNLNLNKHTSQIRDQQSSLEKDYSIHKHSQINDIDIEKHQRALNNIYNSKQSDLNLNSNSLYNYQNSLPNPVLTNLGHNSNSDYNHYLNALNAGYNKHSNIELQKQLSSNFNHGLHGFNKRFVDKPNGSKPLNEENCQLNPDHIE